MVSTLIVLGSLTTLTILIRKNITYGVFWALFTLPLYEVGRVSFGPIPTTVVELNILLLFGWWTAKQITNHKHQITNESQISNSWFDKLTMTIKYVALGLSKGGIWDLVLGISRSAGRVLGSWSWVVLAWLIIATLSTAISPNLREAVGVWKAFFVEPILFLVVFVHIIKKENVLHVFNALIGSGVLVAIIGIFQKFSGAWIENPFWAAETTRRVTSVFPFPNAVGLYLAPISVIALTMAMAELPRITKNRKGNTQKDLSSSTLVEDPEIKTNTKRSFGFLFSFLDSRFHGNDNGKIINYALRFTLYAFSFGSMFLAIAFARSRGALLGIIVGVLFLAIFHRGRRAWYWLGIGLVAITIIFGVGIHTIINRFLTQPTSFTGGNSITIRQDQWRESLSFLADHPIAGSGLSGFQTRIVPYHNNPSVEIYKYPHNVFLNFWTELGLVGLVVFIIIIIKLYYSFFFSTNLNSKHQITSTKSQINNKSQAPNNKFFGVWKLKFLWNLGFGIWNLPNHNTSDNKTDNITRYALGAAFTTLLAHGLVDVPYFKNDLSVLFWILIGISIIITNERKSNLVIK